MYFKLFHGEFLYSDVYHPGGCCSCCSFCCPRKQTESTSTEKGHRFVWEGLGGGWGEDFQIQLLSERILDHLWPPVGLFRDPAGSPCNDPTYHQKFQVPSIQALNLIAGWFGGGFSLALHIPYSLFGVSNTAPIRRVFFPDSFWTKELDTFSITWNPFRPTIYFNGWKWWNFQPFSILKIWKPSANWKPSMNINGWP